MRAVVLLALTGCRSILGIEDGTGFPPIENDGPRIDAPFEASFDAPLGCRADYAPLPNSGPRAHRYLLRNMPGSWLQQRDGCATEAGFLAFPDGASTGAAQMELAALVGVGGTGLWIGVSDLASEGVYRTSLNQLASAITLGLFSSGGNPLPKDCFVATSSTTLIDEDCAIARPALCECVP